MTELRKSSKARPTQHRRWLLHAYRVGIFVFLLLMIHRQHDWYVAQKRGEMKQLVTVEMVRSFFPQAAELSDWDAAHGGQNVFDSSGEGLGYVIQTSPEADAVVGFSGPTNTLVAFANNNRIIGAAVLRSDDTKEHLKQVLKDESFFDQWNDLGRYEVDSLLLGICFFNPAAPSPRIARGWRGFRGRKGCIMASSEIEPKIELTVNCFTL